MSKSICDILKKNDVMYISYIYTTSIDNIYIGCVRYGIRGCRNFSLNSRETLKSSMKYSQYGPLDINTKHFGKWTTLKNSISHINNIKNRFTQIDTYIYNNTLMIYIDNDSFFEYFPKKSYTSHNLFTNFDFKIDKIRSFTLKKIINNNNLFSMDFIKYINRDFIPYLKYLKIYIDSNIENNTSNNTENKCYEYENKKSGIYSFLYPKLEFIEN